LARIEKNQLVFAGEVYLPDGSQMWARSDTLELPKTAPLAARLPIAAALGEKAGRSIAQEAGDLIRFES
jgi:hypothetical protein